MTAYTFVNRELVAPKSSVLSAFGNRDLATTILFVEVVVLRSKSEEAGAVIEGVVNPVKFKVSKNPVANLAVVDPKLNVLPVAGRMVALTEIVDDKG